MPPTTGSVDSNWCISDEYFFTVQLHSNLSKANEFRDSEIGRFDIKHSVFVWSIWSINQTKNSLKSNTKKDTICKIGKSYHEQLNSQFTWIFCWHSEIMSQYSPSGRPVSKSRSRFPMAKNPLDPRDKARVDCSATRYSMGSSATAFVNSTICPEEDKKYKFVSIPSYNQIRSGA